MIGSLGEGLRTFGDKVKGIARVTDAGDATVIFTEKVKAATASYDKLSVAFEKASANLTDLAGSEGDSKAYHEQVNNLAKNLVCLKCGIRAGVTGLKRSFKINEQILSKPFIDDEQLQ